MSLAEKRELLRLISAYSKAQEKIISLVSTLNPEPQIAKCSHQFTAFPEIKLTRLIKWRELRANFYETNPQFYRTDDLDTHTLDFLLENISLHNLNSFLKSDDSHDGRLLAFKIEAVTWFIRLWTDRNMHAHPYAPKRLSSGLKIILNSEELVTSFQAVSKELWYTYDINPTKVVPLTPENFQTVLDFQTSKAKLNLQNNKE